MNIYSWKIVSVILILLIAASEIEGKRKNKQRNKVHKQRKHPHHRPDHKPEAQNPNPIPTLPNSAAPEILAKKAVVVDTADFALPRQKREVVPGQATSKNLVKTEQNKPNNFIEEIPLPPMTSENGGKSGLLIDEDDISEDNDDLVDEDDYYKEVDGGSEFEDDLGTESTFWPFVQRWYPAGGYRNYLRRRGWWPAGYANRWY